MLRWKRRNDGFEWQKHVRTTLRIRREKRRQQMHEAGEAAVEGLKFGAVAVARGSRWSAVTGWRLLIATLVYLWDLLVTVVTFIWDLTVAILTVLWSYLQPLLRALWRARIPLLAPFRTAAVRPRLLIVGWAALIAGIVHRVHVGQFKPETMLALAVGLTALVLAGGLTPPAAVSSRAKALLGRLAMGRRGALVAGSLAVATLAVAGISWMTQRPIPSLGAFMPSLPGLPSLPSFGSEPLTGRISVVAADTLRIGDRVVRLAGIEAPELEQTCTTGGQRRYRCADAAVTALRRAVSVKDVRCEAKGKDSAGRDTASCRAGDVDIAAQLVRQGVVFAETGLLSRYASEESAARTAKAGFWHGEIERPAEFRAKSWEAAKKRAPDGCPIKGSVTGDGKVYVMPWSPGYRAARAQKTRGERWFCTEQEAVAAGFKPAGRS